MIIDYCKWSDGNKGRRGGGVVNVRYWNCLYGGNIKFLDGYVYLVGRNFVVVINFLFI